MTFSEISKKLVELGYRKPKGDYTYDDRKYATFSRNTYSVTVFMDSDFNILNLSFQYVGVKYDFIRLVTTTTLASLRIMSDEEFMDIISRIDIRKMSKYPVDRMNVVLRNITNERAIESL